MEGELDSSLLFLECIRRSTYLNGFTTLRYNDELLKGLLFEWFLVPFNNYKYKYFTTLSICLSFSLFSLGH